MNFFTISSQKPSVWILLSSNLFIVFGVLYLGFNTLSILLLYWAESAVIGFYTILKIIHCNGKPQNQQPKNYGFTHLKISFPLFYKQAYEQPPFTFISKVMAIIFFIFHYSTFMLGHLMFIIFFFVFHSVQKGTGTNMLEQSSMILLGLFFLFLSHGYSYSTNYLHHKEYQKANISTLLFQPYKRIIIMHLTIIIGAFFVLQTGDTTPFLIPFILLKILIDILTHLQERKKFGSLTSK